MPCPKPDFDAPEFAYGLFRYSDQGVYSFDITCFSTCRAMCLIDFGMPVDEENESFPNGVDPSSNKSFDSSRKPNLKRKWKDSSQEPQLNGKKNFDISAFKDPVLFVGHLSEESLLIIEKPWLEVVQTFDAPVHRHIYGT